jgi:hypothetical protein
VFFRDHLANTDQCRTFFQDRLYLFFYTWDFFHKFLNQYRTYWPLFINKRQDANISFFKRSSTADAAKQHRGDNAPNGRIGTADDQRSSRQAYAPSGHKPTTIPYSIVHFTLFLFLTLIDGAPFGRTSLRDGVPRPIDSGLSEERVDILISR